MQTITNEWSCDVCGAGSVETYRVALHESPVRVHPVGWVVVQARQLEFQICPQHNLVIHPTPECQSSMRMEIRADQASVRLSSDS